MLFKFRISVDFLIAFSLGLFFSLSYGSLGAYFTLADRGLYIEGSRPELASLSELNRTLLVAYIFSLFPTLTEFFLGALSLYLQFLLVRRLARSFSLSSNHHLLLIIISFLPIRLLFRTIASKELIFSLAVEIILLLFMQFFNPTSKSSSSYFSVFCGVPVANNYPIILIVIWALFIVALSLRPFYACLIPVIAYLLLSASKLNRPFRFILHWSAFLVALVCVLYFIFNSESFFLQLQSMLNGYFFVDGASAATTRLSSNIPTSLAELLWQFSSNPFQSLLGPTLGEIVSNPRTVIYWPEGVFLMFVFLYSFFRVSCRLLATPLSLDFLITQVMLLFSFLWLLFVYHIFSFINFAGGVRFQSASIPLLIFIVALSLGGTRKTSFLLS